MNFILRVIYSAAIFSAAISLLPHAYAATLNAPAPKSARDFNYTNGDVGSNALGLSAADAADFDEKAIPLAAPNLKPYDIKSDAEVALEREKDSEKCLDSCTK